MNERAKDTFLVMIADDSVNDRDLFRAAVKRTTRLRVIAEAADGAEVVAYLDRHAESSGAGKQTLPDLLLLDLKMPVMNGFKVLEWLRAKQFPGMTVVVFTSSMQPDHIRRALDLGADFFQVKPQSHKDCVTMALALEERMVNGLRTTWPWHAGTVRETPVIHHGV